MTTTSHYPPMATHDDPLPSILRWCGAALLALAVTCVACCDPTPAPDRGELRHGWHRAPTFVAAPRCPDPAPPIPCQPSGEGICADLGGLCEGLELAGDTCADLHAWCLAGDSTCSMCKWLHAEALAQGVELDAHALLVECACLGVADDQLVCAR